MKKHQATMFMRRVAGFYIRKRSRLFSQRNFCWHSETPFISFTFDDFPRSAYRVGGAILQKYKARGSYYVSMGLLGKESPHGEIIRPGELKDVVAEGHEIGSHTFDHLNAWKARRIPFREAILKNQRAMNDILTGQVFKTLSYPMMEPHPRIKKIAAEYFSCCRGGGQTYNNHRIDLNLLKSYFIDKNNRENIDEFVEVIGANTESRGWLVFSTHDVALNPSPCGCRPDFFEEIVARSGESGAIIMPVAEACSQIVALGPS